MASLADILDTAIEKHRREHFLQQANLAYAALAEDRVALRDYYDEINSMDGALGDGLQKFPA